MIGERSSVRKEAARLSMPGEMTLLTVIVFGFLLLHIFTGVLLLSGERKSPEQASLSLSD